MKTVFTTGEAAKICKVSQQTIIRCFDSGRLQGFRVPGSRFRRIPRDELLRFVRRHFGTRLHLQLQSAMRFGEPAITQCPRAAATASASSPSNISTIRS